MPAVPYGFASPQVRRLSYTPLDNVRPQVSYAFVPEDYVLLNGQPAVPQFWMNAEPVITADGSYFTDRPSILDINDDAFVRFVADEDTWDSIGFAWNPLFAQTSVRYQMDGDPLSSPLLSSTDYQIGKELFSNPVLDFDADQILTSNFDSGADDAFSFTIAMAVNIQQTGTNLITFIDGAYIIPTASGFEAMVDGRKFSVAIPKGPTATTPIYLVLDIAPPVATLVAATGPTKIYRGSSAISARTTSFVFTIGGSMEIFSMDIWGDDRPTYTEIVARYASVLGAH